jgi:signal peptidase I
MDEVTLAWIKEQIETSNQLASLNESSFAAPQQNGLTADIQEITEKKSRNQSVWKSLLLLLLKIASILLVLVLLFTFLFGIVRYQDPGMDPAIKDGDVCLFYRHNSGYLPQDIIALEYGGKTQIRRVIATAGDTVDISEEGLMINGALQQELNVYQETQRYQEGVDFPLTVPEGEVFVLGDNRTNATDSRIYGTEKIKDTLGKVMTIIRRRNL